MVVIKLGPAQSQKNRCQRENCEKDIKPQHAIGNEVKL
jgi:hypothetical protein